MGQHCLDCLRGAGAVQPQPVRRGLTGTTRQAVAAPLTTQRPYVTYGLIGFNVAVFVVCVAQAGSTDMLDSSLFADWALFKPFVADGEYWRLITAGSCTSPHSISPPTCCRCSCWAGSELAIGIRDTRACTWPRWAAAPR